MHERALLADLLRRIEEVARTDGAARVTRVEVRVGALSHFTAAHFRGHFADAARGTRAEGAAVDVEVDGDVTDARAADVVLLSVEVEHAEPAEAR